MDNVDEYLKDLEVLFEMDLLNKFEKIDNSIVVTMQDDSKVRVQVMRVA